jgi:hypothetical protein
MHIIALLMTYALETPSTSAIWPASFIWPPEKNSNFGIEKILHSNKIQVVNEMNFHITRVNLEFYERYETSHSLFVTYSTSEFGQ